MDLLAVAEHIILPALGLLGGWTGAAFRFHHRLDELNKKDEERTKEIALLRAEMRDGFATARDARAEMTAHFAELENISDLVNEMRKSSQDFAKDAELGKMVSDFNAAILKIERAIGQLEGTVTVMVRHRSGGGDSERPSRR